MAKTTMTYYPYGEPWSQPQGQPWLFGGKEREQRHHLGDSDFGARTYNAARATFAQPDPLCERYYPINPYTFCAADPINHIDPTGMDVNVSITDEDAVFSARFFAIKDHARSARHSAKIINVQSGSFLLIIPPETKDGKISAIPIKFDAQVDEVENPDNPIFTQGKLTQAISPLIDSGETNINAYMVVPDKDIINDAYGKATHNFVRVAMSFAYSETGAHEMVHTFGAGHSSGLMSVNKKSGRTEKLSTKSVEQMWKSVMKPSNSSDLGRGTLINKSKFKEEQLQKAKIMRKEEYEELIEKNKRNNNKN